MTRAVARAAAAVLAVCRVAGLRRRFVIVTVRGPSMLPTLAPGQRVLVRRCAGDTVAAGDVVVLRGQPSTSPGAPPIRRPTGPEWLIKRALAVPGDPVPRALVPALAGVGHELVPAGSLVVLGDNAGASVDSRQYGYVDAERLVGTVVRTLS